MSYNNLTEEEMIKEINKLKKEKNAVILAHNYQIPEVQDIADFVGDTLEIIKKTQKIKENIIVVAGVDYIAQTIKIINPFKRVLLPIEGATCPMINTIDLVKLRDIKKSHSDTSIICYINSSLQVKAESDICCTASNLAKIINSVSTKKIIFLPDKNIGKYIIKTFPQKEIILWDGFCKPHEEVKQRELLIRKLQHPKASILVHPQCPIEILEKADFIGSSSEIIKYATESDNKSFIIGSEMGILHRLRKNNTNKKFYLMSPALVCFDMKKTTLKDIYLALLNEKKEINIHEDLRLKAFLPLQKMLSIQ